MVSQINQKYAGLFLPAPRKQVYVEYTLGGVSPLLGDNGLLSAKLRNGYRIVKVKCVGNPEADFERIMAVYGATKCQLWLDFNGSGTPDGVRYLCKELRNHLPQGVLLAVEQPFSIKDTFSIDVRGMAHVPFWLDESAVLPADILATKALGYLGIVVKADKGGLSHVAEMVRVAKEHGMLVSVQDLTSDPWPSLGIASYLRDLHGHIAEMNQIELLVTPKPVVIQNGRVDTSQLTGPGFYP
jgi:L-alanine-DL-glutamate epimerase-like enolase superfamily enzyme